jgi:hypothetical protein
MNDCYTITFGDCAENSIGMEQIGSISDKGYTDDELCLIKNNIENDFECIHYDLKSVLENSICDDLYKSIPETSLLLVKNFIPKALGLADATDKLYSDLTKLECDKKYWSYGRVVNKNARHNLCMSDFDQKADYENKKGTVINFTSVPILNDVRQILPTYFGDKAISLQGELNHYYDVTKCGIGYHGDTERKIVFGLRIGKPIPLTFTWFYKNQRLTDKIIIIDNICSGDLYVMSDYAVGNNWKKRNICTIRHAAGCNKYTLLD